jgi:hypothetical protein
VDGSVMFKLIPSEINYQLLDNSNLINGLARHIWIVQALMNQSFDKDVLSLFSID